MYHISTSIEISASPEAVREKFLDFSQLPNYHPNGLFKVLGPLVPGEPLNPGLKMHNELDGMTFEPTLLENSPACFRWQGSGLMGTFKGQHIFRFESSKTTPGGTTFTHEEKFTGLLSFIMSEGSVARSIGLREKTQNGFIQYNNDLKKWCE
ncbi:hypothetical protein ASPZODRAFT_99032 [Penicilliopsis zonata CBS 506.65]|uniref:Uncharacterized protein n=1 Tax=Penicilliopsis zonata CBS 506.65 TaxID=1073090 RepID=A0A1L9SFM1_9EURO|nr:hypothetical protein ASPZODRAFT_99032 [Penicilliopsis zonata CBS 506.65]OJJ45966.1 hypothetical protein ASPZODRAFT_99032 [Penicilliopsis zonata CBS 506.65]